MSGRTGKMRAAVRRTKGSLYLLVRVGKDKVIWERGACPFPLPCPPVKGGCGLIASSFNLRYLLRVGRYN